MVVESRPEGGRNRLKALRCVCDGAALVPAALYQYPSRSRHS